jgi:hypothetical protein
LLLSLLLVSITIDVGVVVVVVVPVVSAPRIYSSSPGFPATSFLLLLFSFHCCRRIHTPRPRLLLRRRPLTPALEPPLPLLLPPLLLLLLLPPPLPTLCGFAVILLLTHTRVLAFELGTGGRGHGSRW